MLSLLFSELTILTLFCLETAFAFVRWKCRYHPVCATDGITYNNECEFRVAAFKNEDLQILVDGRCPRSLKFKNEVLNPRSLVISRQNLKFIKNIFLHPKRWNKKLQKPRSKLCLRVQLLHFSSFFFIGRFQIDRADASRGWFVSRCSCCH